MDERTNEFIESFDRVVNNISLTKAEGQEIAQRVVNTHRTLQQNKMRLIILILKEWTEMDMDGRYDLRNEAAVKLATKLLAGVKEDDLVLPMI